MGERGKGGREELGEGEGKKGAGVANGKEMTECCREGMRPVLYTSSFILLNILFLVAVMLAMLCTIQKSPTLLPRGMQRPLLSIPTKVLVFLPWFN